MTTNPTVTTTTRTFEGPGAQATKHAAHDSEPRPITNPNDTHTGQSRRAA